MFFKNKNVKELSSNHHFDAFSKKSKGLPFSILGSQTLFQGKLILKGEARLAGQVEGTIIAEDTLIIEEGASIKGEIHGIYIEVCGTFEGTLVASDTLKVSSTAKILGDICAAKLVVEEGAKIRGQINSIEVQKFSEKPKIEYQADFEMVAN